VAAHEAGPKRELLKIILNYFLLRDQLLKIVVGNSTHVTVVKLLRILVVPTKWTCLNFVCLTSIFSSPADKASPVEGVLAEHGNVEVRVIPLFFTYVGCLCLFVKNVFKTYGTVFLLKIILKEAVLSFKVDFLAFCLYLGV